MLKCLGLPDITLQCDPEPSFIKWAESDKSDRQERTVWISRLRSLYKNNSIVIRCPVHQTKIVTVAKLRRICTRSGSIVMLLPPSHRHTEKTIADANGPKMHDNDKKCLMLQPACLCPNSWENDDDRHSKMTDKETRHAPKSMLTSIGPRQKGNSGRSSTSQRTDVPGAHGPVRSHPFGCPCRRSRGQVV